MENKKLDVVFKVLSLINIVIALMVALNIINFSFIWVTLALTLIVSIPQFIKSKDKKK